MRDGSLADQDATITRTDYGDGVVVPVLLVEHCEPCVRAGRPDHAHVIPFHDAASTRLRAGDRDVPVWQRTAGSSVADLTLSPSYLVPSCGLHGHVVGGRWVSC